MQNSKMQHAMYSGAILGVFLLVKFYISVLGGENILVSFVGVALTLLVPYIIYKFQIRYRDEQLNGFITYSNSFTYGIMLYFYACLILAVGQFVYYRFINPDFLTNAFKMSIDMMQRFGMPEKIIDEAIAMPIPSPISTVLQSILMNSFIGLLISAVTSLIVKRTDLFNAENE